ncbi:subtilisin-like protease PR1D [Metarhizium album ARSEF 1941]|uniref:Subtilisin-like protease PR1D n=1 Tax=Metarhizium album (strain ARSEF 1941) TaxID=1081103 RepID=A0A0B2X3S9_METAS|nr:subtilisin-like protease PR1D [Metarhizium album ARSEF 1941]KHO00403.1 subtilisin-like protease PR1D [Metarhizium album ARSEF 1941]
MFFKIIAAAASALACLSAAAAAPVHSRASSSAVIEGSYIVRLKENVATDTHMSWVRGIHARSNGKNDPAGVEREYNGPAFRGYAGPCTGTYAYIVDSGVSTAHWEFRGDRAANSVVLAGFAWAVNDIISKNRQDRSVINLSLGGSYSQAWDDAIESAFSNGVLSIVAAGNGQVDAQTTSPASAPNAVTVGAVGRYGTALDLFAPGDNILSAGSGSDSAVRLDSGTSMATSYVTGLALYAMSVNGVRGAKAVTSHLISNSGKNVITGPLRCSPNRLANNGNTIQRTIAR